MKRLLLIILVALLPLKAWAGDAMAVGMAMAAGSSVAMSTATENRATNADSAGATARFDTKTSSQPLTPHDCAGHAALPSDASHNMSHGSEHGAQSSDASPPPQGSACADCDACHSLALTAGPPPTLPARPGLGSPVSISPSDTSVHRSASHKPPIA